MLEKNLAYSLTTFIAQKDMTRFFASISFAIINSYNLYSKHYKGGQILREN